MTDPVAAQYRDMAYASHEVWVIQMWDAMNNQIYRKSQEIEQLGHDVERLTATASAEATENERLRTEVQRLQRAIHFWLPHVPATGSHEVLMRTGDDAMLLVGYDPTEPVELDAEARGWITLNAQPQPGKQT